MSRYDKMRELDPEFMNVIDCVIDTMIIKSKDYSDNGYLFATVENAASASGMPLDAAFEFMIAMKTSRIKVLRGKEQANNESIDDSMIDRIAYAIGQCALARQGGEVV
jgi:hypothetical protein